MKKDIRKYSERELLLLVENTEKSYNKYSDLWENNPLILQEELEKEYIFNYNQYIYFVNNFKND